MTGAHDVRITREGRWWTIEVPTLGAVTQSRRIGDAERMARELIARHTDLKVDEVQVTPTITVAGEAIDDRIRTARTARAEADTQEARAAETYRSVTKELAAGGVPVRDIGELLGISHQRAHQLAAG